MSIERSFAPMPDSVGEARIFVLNELSQLPQITRERIGLIVSELATNAVIHAATPFTVALTASGETLTIEVTDQGGGEPEPHHYPPPPSNSTAEAC